MPGARSGRSDFPCERVYFRCPVTAGHHKGGHPGPLPAPWSAMAPTRSLWYGEGCVRLHDHTRGANLYQATFYGEFAGDLRDLTVTLHDLMAGQGRPEGVDAVPLSLGLEIDGRSVLPADPAGPPTLWVTPVDEDNDLVQTLEFSVAGLDALCGGGARSRSIQLTVSASPIEPCRTPPVLFAWNAIEAPSGVLFNPTAPATDHVVAPPGE